MNPIVYENIGETLWADKLPNGLTLLVVPKKGYAKTFAMLAANYGGADRRFKYGGEWIDTPAGIAHFLEHKAFDMPDGSNVLGVFSANGASPNAFTGAGMTAYHFECTHDFADNLRLLLRFVSTPYFTPGSVEKEQGIIGQEIRMLDDMPGWAIYNNLMRALYAHNPIRDSVGGTVESIARITDETLYACHKIFYNPSNMTLAVVGDVSPGQVRAIALEILPQAPGEVPERDYGPPEGVFPVQKQVSAAMEVAVPQLLIGTKLTPEKDGRALLRQMLVADLALDCLVGRSSPFYLKNYADGLLNRDFSAGLDCTAGGMTLMLGGETRDPDAVAQAFFTEAGHAAQTGLDAALFARVQKSAFGARLRALGSFGGLCSELAQSSFLGYNPFEAFACIERITKEDADRFVRASLTQEKLAVSILTPRRDDQAERPSASDSTQSSGFGS